MNLEELSFKEWLIISLLVLAIGITAGFFIGKRVAFSTISKTQNGETLNNSALADAPTSTKIKVYITGAVNLPDVYEIEEGSILRDLLYLAGGPTGDADLYSVNLAQILEANSKVLIPFKNTSNLTGTQGSSLTNPQNGKININIASQAELEKLPGIGPSKAQAIIDYREKYGSFKKIEDIMKVKGIGEKTFESIKDLITV